MKDEVRYISHGDLEDGGYRHELFFAQSLANHFNLSVNEQRKRRLYSGLSNLSLFSWGFFKSSAKYNVVSARLGIGSWLKNLFNSNKTYVVVHDYDECRYNSFFLKLYYPLLFSIFRNFKPKRMKMVVISPYWVNYFHEDKKIGVDLLLLFPNLLNVAQILKERSETKQKMVHLGQYSKKNSNLVFEIASKLSKKGYFCYFSTLDKGIVSEYSEYSILHFPDYESYLKKMAESQCTLGFSRFHEGWNRVVHESALLNTPVIAFRKGGMQFLVQESNNYLVDSISQAIDIITKNEEYKCPESFIYKYDVSKAPNYLKHVH